MKTPREILFERHRQAEPKLDAVRLKALATLPAAGSVNNAHFNTRAAVHRARAVLRKAWLELILPSRRAWAGMAVLWLAVLAANLEMNAKSTTVPAVRSAHTGELARAFEEQHRLLTELLLPVNPPPAAVVRSNPGPRSERLTLFQAG